MRRAVLPASLLFIVAPLAARQPAPQILGLRLGMSYAEARSRLIQIGQFKSEEEGQQVWTLTHDQRYQYAIIGFDRDRQVRFVTVLVRQDGKPVSYADVGEIAQATRAGGPGNFRYTWTLSDKAGRFAYLAIAKGKDPQHLDQYAVKRLGVENQREDRD